MTGIIEIISTYYRYFKRWLVSPVSQPKSMRPVAFGILSFAFVATLSGGNMSASVLAGVLGWLLTDTLLKRKEGL